MIRRGLRVAAFYLAGLASLSTAQADPLGFVNYPALLEARAGQTFCTGGALCTVVLPGGAIVQQDADGRWLAGGAEMSAGGFALGYALMMAIYDRCGRHLESVDPDRLEGAIATMLEVYALGLGIEGTGQAVPSDRQLTRAFAQLRVSLAGYLEDDPDLSRCIVPGRLAVLLEEMADEAYFTPELDRLRETPMLPTPSFRIE